MGFIQGLRYPEELENIVLCSLYKNNFQEQRYRGFTTVSTSEVIGLRYQKKVVVEFSVK